MAEIIKNVKQLIEEANKIFNERFGYTSTVKAFGPGRVNLIGEHTDYNQGFVFPMALPMGTVIVGSINNLSECRVFTMSSDISVNKFVTFQIPKDKEIIKSDVQWANYIIGVIAYFEYDKKQCFDAVVNSSLPLGSGLSSSASLEVAFYTFLEGLYQIDGKLNFSDKAFKCQQAEHYYADVPCGIMDQYIGFMGKKDHALKIDCRDISSELIKLENNIISILIINSNMKHNLGYSEYPLRRRDCFLAARVLNKTFLRDASLKELEDSIEKMEPRVYMRARHVITENKRVLDSIEALLLSDFDKFGKLMNESHSSLRDDFEVSCKEIDQLVEIVQSCRGILGSRMTGAGFGGCIVSLVYNTEIANVIQEVKKRYKGNPIFYICTADDGAKLYN